LDTEKDEESVELEDDVEFEIDPEEYERVRRYLSFETGPRTEVSRPLRLEKYASPTAPLVPISEPQVHPVDGLQISDEAPPARVAWTLSGYLRVPRDDQSDEGHPDPIPELPIDQAASTESTSDQIERLADALFGGE
jgi:hypothetical protein